MRDGVPIIRDGWRLSSLQKAKFFYEIRDGLPVIRDGWRPNLSFFYEIRDGLPIIRDR